MTSPLPIPEAFPVAITLRFRDEAEKSFFLGGLIDGWGENAATLFWSAGVDCDDADTFCVDPWHDEEEEG